MTVLVVLNEAGERGYNALRLATALADGGEHSVTVFLLGDGVFAGLASQDAAPPGRDLGWMLRRLAAGGARILACGTCLDQRGITEAALIEEVKRSTLDALTALTTESQKVLVF